MRVVSVGKTAASRGSKNSPRWILSRLCPRKSLACRRTLGERSCISEACECHNLSVTMLLFKMYKTQSLNNSRVTCHSSIWWLYAVSLSLTWVYEESDNSTLYASLSIFVYIVWGYSDGKMQVGNLGRSSLSCNRSKNRYPCGLRVAYRYALKDPLYLRDIPDEPDRLIDSYPARFLMPLYTMRSKLYRDSTAPDERGSG